MNNLKRKIKDGEFVIGTWNIIPSPSLVEAIGSSGIDFIVIDAEHGPADMETAENLIRAAEVSGMVPIIRVPCNESHMILRALDIGASGIQVPHVSTKEEAESVVEYAKYHPMGQRGLSPFTRAAKYGIRAEGHTVRSNEDTMVIVNVEGIEGIRNIKEISKVKGVDVVFIGPYDLSQSLGKPGKVDDADVVSLIKGNAKNIKEAGKVSGSFARDMKYMEILFDCGVQYITYKVDSAVVAQTYNDIKTAFNKLTGGR